MLQCNMQTGRQANPLQLISWNRSKKPKNNEKWSKYERVKISVKPQCRQFYTFRQIINLKNNEWLKDLNAEHRNTKLKEHINVFCLYFFFRKYHRDQKRGKHFIRTIKPSSDPYNVRWPILVFISFLYNTVVHFLVVRQISVVLLLLRRYE